MSLFERENMSIDEIIQRLQEAVDLGDSPHRGPFGTHIRKEYLVEAIDKLKTHQDAQPNDPLTIMQIMKREGKPVWAVGVPLGCTGAWRIIANCDAFECSFERPGGGRQWYSYNARADDGRLFPSSWVLYDHPPKDMQG